MSFICGNCKLPVVSDRNKLREGRKGIVQRVAKPNRIVTKRHGYGQIKEEQDWCNRCVEREFNGQN